MNRSRKEQENSLSSEVSVCKICWSIFTPTKESPDICEYCSEFVHPVNYLIIRGAFTPGKRNDDRPILDVESGEGC